MKRLLRKNILLFIHLIHKTSISVYLSHSVSLSASSQSLSSSSPHTLITSPSYSLPFYNISWFSSIPLAIQHFVKSFTVTFGEMRCIAFMIHIIELIHASFLVYKLIWTHEDSQFSPQMVSVMLRILNTRVVDCCVASVVWSVWFHVPVYVFKFVCWSRFYFWVCS